MAMDVGREFDATDVSEALQAGQKYLDQKLERFRTERNSETLAGLVAAGLYMLELEATQSDQAEANMRFVFTVPRSLFDDMKAKNRSGAAALERRKPWTEPWTA